MDPRKRALIRRAANEESYQPEHERLGRTPIEYPVSKAPATGPNTVGYHNSGPKPAPQMSRTKGIYIPASAANPPQPKVTRAQPKVVPAQPYVHVGVHNEQEWFDDELVAGIHPSQMIDNNEYVDTEALQIKSELISADVEEEQETPTPPPIPGTLSDVEPGEYVLMMRNNIVLKTRDLNQLKNLVEELLLSETAELSDILVFRCLGLDFGLMVTNE